jgi:hypothetical protein
VIRSGTNLIDQTYARNTKGLITAITSPDATRSWTYRKNLQLVHRISACRQIDLDQSSESLFQFSD